MRLLRFVALTVALLACFSFIVSSNSISASPLRFEQVGPNAQDLNAGESVVYEWFLYNGGNVSILVQVTYANDFSSGPGWSSDISVPIAVLRPGDSLFVNLTVSAKGDVESIVVNQTLYFSVENLNNSSSNNLYVGNAKTSMIPTWGVIAPGKNKLFGQFDNPLPAPFNGNYATFLVNLGIWGLIALIFAFIIGPAAKVFTKRTKTDLDDRVLKVLHKPIFVLVIVFGFVSSLTILPLTEREVGTIYEAYGVALIAIITFVVYKLFKEIIIHFGKKWSEKTETEIDDVLIPVLDKIGGLVILVFGVVAALGYLHYNITFLLAGVGVFGLVIAFAAQDALSNFFSGIALLLDRPFTEGEYVTLATGELCRVERIGIRSCRLYDVFQNNYIVLPNNKLVNDKIVNMNEPDDRGVVEVSVNVAPGTDVTKVESILAQVAADDPDVMQEEGREPAVRLSSFGESSLEFKLFVWVENFMMKWRVAHELRKEILRRFNEQGVEIAVPQRKIYLHEKAK